MVWFIVFCILAFLHSLPLTVISNKNMGLRTRAPRYALELADWYMKHRLVLILFTTVNLARVAAIMFLVFFAFEHGFVRALGLLIAGMLLARVCLLYVGGAWGRIFGYVVSIGAVLVLPYLAYFMLFKYF